MKFITVTRKPVIKLEHKILKLFLRILFILPFSVKQNHSFPEHS